MNNRRRSVIIANEESGGGIPRNGLIAEWLLQNDALDTSGFGHDFTSTNVTFVSSGLNSTLSQAASFSGNGSLIQSDPIFPNTDSFSFSFWMNASRYGTSSSADVIFNPMYYSSTASGRDGLECDLYDSKIRLYIARSNSYIASTEISATTGVWYHVCCNVDRVNNQLTMYLNNTLASQVAINGTFTNPHPLYLGYAINGANPSYKYYYRGLLAAYRVYSRLLSLTEISLLYAEGQ